MKKIGRNDMCHCGSRIKYKHCCLNIKSSNSDDKLEQFDKHIKQEYYEQLNKQFMKEYELEFGINPFDINNRNFTKEEQIERITKNYLFWKKRMPVENTGDMNGYDLARSWLCSNAMTNMLKHAKKLNIEQDVCARISYGY